MSVKAVNYRGGILLASSKRRNDLGAHAFTPVVELLVCSCAICCPPCIQVSRYDELVLTHGELRRVVSGAYLGTEDPVA